MKFPTYPFKQLLSGGLLCCLILLAAYIFQAFFPGMYVDAFSSSMHLLMWLILFVGALLWTFRAKGERIGISEVIDWQFIAAFILITADEIVAAGSGKYATSNSSYYLYKGSWYWSLSPASMYASTATVLVVYSDGQLYSFMVYSSGGVAPVINLKAEYASTLKGTGTIDDPYTAE